MKHKADRLGDPAPATIAQDANAAPVFRAALSDITERKQAEEALAESGQRYRMLFDAIDEGFCIVEVMFDENEKPIDYRFLEMNSSFENQTGLVDAQGKRMRELVPNHEEHWFETYGRIALTGQPARFVNRAEHLHRWYDVYAFRVDRPENRHVAILFNDITERKHAEEEKARLLVLIDESPDFIGVADLQGNLLYHNRAAKKMVGLPEDADLSHMKIRDMYPRWAAKLVEEEGIPTVLREGTWRSENVLLHQNGREIPVSQVLVVHRNSAGEPTFISTIMRDITDRKRAEAEQAALQNQLAQAQKMESVGLLAGGVAHDFNNMLGVILGHAELALAQVDPAQPLHADLEEIHKATIRSADLTRQLLAFARKQTVAPKILDLNETVTGMLKMLQRLIGENIDLRWQPGVDVWPVKVDPSQIDQILANLCINARDAIAGVGTLTIETGNSTLDERFCAANVGCAPGDYVRLALTDTGCGMDKETLSHLFEPFFTTKVMGKGTGLGLATVYGIVKQNDGFIYAYSEPNLGTTFKVYLPRHVGEAGQARTEAAARPAPRGHETILLVEDEPAILTLTKRVLEQRGYTVLAASTPGEAISLAKEHPGEINLLITDVIMPEMNGRILAKNLLSVYPHLKHLFMSGYTADVIAHDGVLDEGVHFIEKPFSTEDLASKVRNALDAQN